jgi:hypothetical protein
MMTGSGDVALWIGVVGFAAMGIGAMVRPVAVTAQFGIDELSAAGRNEVRAVYGGFGILMSTVLWVAIHDPALRAGICVAVAAALGGMSAGRAVSAIVDRRIDRWPLFYGAIECVCAASILASA